MSVRDDSVQTEIPTVIVLMDGKTPQRLVSKGVVNIEFCWTDDSGRDTLGVSGHGMDASTHEPIPMHTQTSRVAPCAFTWDQVVEAWESNARMLRRSPEYIPKVVRLLDRLRTHAGVELIHELDADMVRAYLSDLAEQGTRGKPISAKTMNNYTCGLRNFFEWCKKNERVPASWANPCRDIDHAKVQQKQARALKLDEAIAIFEAARADEQSANPSTKHADGSVVVRSGFYWILLCTGIRISTAEHLRVKHILLDDDVPKVQIPAFNSGKNSRERTIVISEHDREILRSYFENHPRNLGPDDLAFTRPHHRVLLRDAEKAGVPAVDPLGRNLGFHCFRRLHATQLLRMKTDPKLVQQRLGHSTVVTTLKHYNDVQESDQVGVAEALGALISKKNITNPLDSIQRMTDTVSDRQSGQASENKTITNPCGIEPPGPTDDHHRLGSPASFGDLPRSAGKRIEIGVRGFEPPTF